MIDELLDTCLGAPSNCNIPDLDNVKDSEA